MKSTSLKLLQVSDCHVSMNPGASYRGLNADHELAGLLPVIREWQPDRILLTGDVAEDASPAAYGRVSAALGTLDVPVLALPGNHDEPEVMSHFFPLGPWSGPVLHGVACWQIVLLNSTAPGVIAGVLEDRELEQLDEALRHSKGEHLLVALHHQPVKVNSPWIDKYALQRPERLLDLLRNDGRVRAVTWGHVHQAFDTEWQGIRMLSSPSTVANSLSEKERFTPDRAGPACRWLELKPDGSLETGIMRRSAP